MAAGTFTLYKRNIDQLKLSDLVSANIRMSLHTSGYTPVNNTSTGHYLLADLSSAVTGGGYAADSLTGVVAETAGTDGFKFSTEAAAWTAAGSSIAAWKTAVIYYNGTIWGRVNPLIGYFLGDSGGADVPATTDTNTLTINCPATGWFDVK